MTTRADLQIIFETFQRAAPKKMKIDIFSMLAVRLAALANRQPWTWRYIQSVHNGTVDPSRQLSRAVHLMTMALDGQKADMSDAKPVQIMTARNVHHHALITADSKLCAFPSCTIQFVPTVPWAKYCPRHRK